MSNSTSSGIKLLKSQPPNDHQQMLEAPIYYLNQPAKQAPAADQSAKLFLNDLNVESSRPVLFVVLTPSDLQNLTNGGGVDSNLVKQLQYVASASTAKSGATNITPTVKQEANVEPKTIKPNCGSNCSSRTSSLNLNLDDALKLHSELESLLATTNGGMSDETSGKSVSNSSQIKFRFDDDSRSSATTSSQNLPRNNIDYAIDAVLELCRQDSESAYSDSAAPKKKKKPPVEVQIQPLIAPQTPPPPPPPPPMSTAAAQQQSMSKSSKARTSYISSLIANREKTVKSLVNDESSSSPSPSTGEEKKKTAQNIYSILATSSPAGKQPVNNNPVQIQPKQLKSKPKSDHMITSINNLNSINSVDFVLAGGKQPQQITSQASSTPKLMLNTSDSLLTVATPAPTSSSPLASDCSNLKRLLAQPIDQTVSLKPAVSSIDSELNMSLVEATSLIKVVIQNLDCEAAPVKSKKKTTAAAKTTTKPKPILAAAVAVAAAPPPLNPTTPDKPPVKRKRNPTSARKPNNPTKESTPAPVTAAIQLPQATVQPAGDSNKPKKLKTIADIVKHQSVQQMAAASSLPPTVKEPLPLVRFEQAALHQPVDSKMTNEDLTISWINHNHTSMMMINNENDCKTHHSGADDMNIEQLLELELNSSNAHHHDSNNRDSASSPIDKFIDLDDIDVNPLDCYRSGQHHHHQHHQHQSVGNKASTSLDEFNLQFSVCSTSSSGFSEPSNFSTCSSICSSSSSNVSGSFMNGLGGGVYGDESSPYAFVDHSPPIQYHHNPHHHHISTHHHAIR